MTPLDVRESGREWDDLALQDVQYGSSVKLPGQRYGVSGCPESNMLFSQFTGVLIWGTIKAVRWADRPRSLRFRRLTESIGNAGTKGRCCACGLAKCVAIHLSLWRYT